MTTRETLPLLRLARCGNAEAQVALGRLYLEGAGGLPKSPPSAFHWLEKAAAQGSREAVRLIGNEIPASATPDFARALEIFEQAAPESDSAQRILACGRLAEMGDGQNAESLLIGGAKRGDPVSQLLLGCLYQSDDEPAIDVNRANYWFERAARQGSLAAQHVLADYHWRRSDPRAAEWLAPLAERGDIQACYRYGVLLVSMNRSSAAVSWIKRAAVLGHPEAQLALGLLYAAHGGVRENGVPHNYKKAASWLEKAAGQGQAQASYELHRLYSLRTFSLHDAATAHYYLERASEQGHPQAQYLLGKALWRRKLVPDADVTAATWLVRASRKGHVQATALLRSVAPAPAVVADRVRSARDAAIRALATTHLALAMRLELACAFGLYRHELLFLSPAEADRGDFLVLDVRQHFAKSRRRIVLVESSEQREILSRGKRLLPAGLPAPGDLTGDARHRLCQMRRACEAHEIDLSLFDARRIPSR